MLDLSTVNMTQARVYKEAFLEGEFLLVRKMLETRCGKLSEDILSRLKQASKEKLENWAIALLSAKTLDDVFTKTND